MNDNQNAEAQAKVSAIFAAEAAERRATVANVESNGRFFVLALVAIAIASGNLKGAVLIASILGVACIVDQLPGHARTIGAVSCYGAALVFAVALLVAV